MYEEKRQKEILKEVGDPESKLKMHNSLSSTAYDFPENLFQEEQQLTTNEATLLELQKDIYHQLHLQFLVKRECYLYNFQKSIEFLEHCTVEDWVIPLTNHSQKES